MSRIDWKKAIPVGFYNASQPTPRAKTVGELIAVLQQLPPSLPVKDSFSNCVEVHVYNIGNRTRHVQIHEPD